VALDQELREVALRLGLAGYGVTTAEPFLAMKAELEARKGDGRAGRLGFTFSDPETATDVRCSFPWAKRLVVTAYAYLPAGGDPGPGGPGTGRIARFAVEDFYVPFRDLLEVLAEPLRTAGYRSEILVDDNRLVDRAAAIRAGVAWAGRSTMSLMPGAGPWTLIGTIVTDALIETTASMRRTCGTCDVCIPACPTGALDGDGGLDAAKCLAAVAQTAGMIPAELRASMGDRLYGCDDCLTVCPPGLRLLDTATLRRGRVDLVALLGAADPEILRRYGHFYIPRRHPRYLRRNALVALGNSGTRRHVGVVAGYLANRDWLLRLHAAWALGRIGGPTATSALQARAVAEGHPEVRREIAVALKYAARR
jgi:epoxyqueuosine reductase